MTRNHAGTAANTQDVNVSEALTLLCTKAVLSDIFSASKEDKLASLARRKPQQLR
jgi:hypothetical protein